VTDYDGFGLLFVVLIVVVVAYAMGWRPDGGHQGHSEPRESALDILKARYARGEISKAEYEAMRVNLAD